jgi:hypothetical protein
VSRSGDGEEDDRSAADRDAHRQPFTPCHPSSMRPDVGPAGTCSAGPALGGIADTGEQG